MDEEPSDGLNHMVCTSKKEIYIFSEGYFTFDIALGLYFLTGQVFSFFVLFVMRIEESVVHNALYKC